MKLIFILLFFHNIICINLDCLIFFGDSLSDSGNLHKLTLGLYPDERYYEGRYSNGRIWSDYIQDYINVTNVENWAYAGATTSNSLTYVNPIIPSVGMQLSWFKLKDNSCYQNQTKDHLVSYIAGGNNYLNDTITPERTVQDIRNQLLVLINDLNFKNIFVSDLPPMHETPSFTGTFLKPNETSPSVHNDPLIELKVKLHNKLLEKLIEDLTFEYPLVNLYFWKFSTIWQAAKYLNPFKSDNWNVNLPCFDDRRDFDGCHNDKDYFFFDTFHPITQVHELIAKDIFDFLKKSWRGKCPKLDHPYNNTKIEFVNKN